MHPHEESAVLYYGLNNNIDTIDWDMYALPAEHIASFKAYVRRCYNNAIERRNEPDDPGDQAYWQERVNEWRDILDTLTRTYA